jgi:hypothetical protein
VNARKPAPIGPLAIAIRHLRSASGGRQAATVAVVLGLALLTGLALLLIR